METTEENKEISVVQPKSNLLVAILCSILFGLVGAVIYGVLYYIGYIAWIGAYAVVILAGFGYKKFYGKIDKKGYVFVTIISVVEVFLSMFIALGITISATYDVSFGTAISAMFEVLDNPEVKSAFISDTIFSLIFIIAGIATYIVVEKRKNQQGNGLVDSNSTAATSNEQTVVSTEEGKTEDNQTDVAFEQLQKTEENSTEDNQN